ncbi:MAG TPA: hypothetical protein VLI40_08960, partial [Gemmatimonadaceae bacterium]|nr:hypothetical protein [Gemmatimonadaceae bacterium]
LESRAAHGGYVDPYAIARVYAAIGDTTRMWPSLTRAVTSGVWELWGLHSDPAFRAYRNDARFQRLDERARQL